MIALRPAAGRLVAVVLGAVLLAAVSAALVRRGAPPATGAGLLAAGAVVALLLTDARAALLVAVGAIVLAEDSANWGLPITTRLYAPTPVGLTPSELLVGLALAAAVIDVARRRTRVTLPAPLAAGLGLTSVALAAGLATGLASGAARRFEVVSFVENLVPLLVLPPLVAAVVRTERDLREALWAACALAGVKAVAGLGVLIAGISQTATADTPALTYYEPAANLLMLVALLGVVAALLSRAPVPAWLVPAAPLLLAALVLSYRRSFWIAGLLALALVILLAGGTIGRRLAVPAVALAVGLGWLVAAAGIVDLQGPVVQRAASLDPGRIERNTQDRYRIAERRNVERELRRHPVLGLGAGVEWEVARPLPFEYAQSRAYVHVGALWWWLKMGLLGLVAYVALFAGAAWTGVAVWRRHPDGQVRAAGLAVGVGLLGLMVVELTAAMTGPDFRLTTLVGALLGLLAVMHRGLAR